MGLGSLLFGGKAQARKKRSIAQLENEAVPVNPHLPPILRESKTRRRTKEEVANRALGAMIAAIKGETRDDDLIDAVIRQYEAQDVFTPTEHAFISTPTPFDEEYVKFAWRYERVHVLLWALGFLSVLPYPADIVHVPDMAKIFNELGREGILTQAELRPQSEILDVLDLTYRYNWACVTARQNKRHPPSNLDAGVVYERHCALTWLVGYSDLEWDEISGET